LIRGRVAEENLGVISLSLKEDLIRNLKGHHPSVWMNPSGAPGKNMVKNVVA